MIRRKMVGVLLSAISLGLSRQLAALTLSAPPLSRSRISKCSNVVESGELTSGVSGGECLHVWSLDAAKGAYDAATDTWIPGRGSDGRVTLASWGLVPPGRWVRVSGTRMDALDSVVKAMLPGWSDRGTGRWDGLTRAWSGMALDTATNRPRAWLFGGGHHDSSNNGLYRLDIAKMSWAVEIMPTDLTGGDSRYTTAGTSTFTSYPPALDYKIANPHQNVISNDCFYPFAPNVPTARHTYSSLVFDPVRNKIYTGVGRMWIADLSSGTWSARIPFGSNVGAFNGLAGMAFENTFGFLHNGRYNILGTQAGNMSRPWEYDPDINRFEWRPGMPGGYMIHKGVSCKVGNFVYTFNPLFESKIWFAKSDLVARTYVNNSLSASAALTDTTRNDYDGGGMTYVPEVEKLLLATRSVATGRLRLYWIDPVHYSIDFDITPGNWPASPMLYVESKLQYVPQIKSILFIDRASDDVRVLRF